MTTRAELIELEERVAALPTHADAVVAWFIDIDGVLNAVDPARACEWIDYRTIDINGPYMIDRVHWAPQLVRILNQLHAKKLVSFRWLTTWEHNGPKLFAPAVGLDIGEWVAGEDLSDRKGWWKLDIMLESFKDATDLVIWTDDDIRHYPPARRVVDFLHPDQALIICPDTDRGLTPMHISIILNALERALAS